MRVVWQIALLLLITRTAYAQYEISILEQLESDYSRLRTEGRYEEAYNLVNELTFYQRINYGLFTQRQAPYICEALKHLREIGNYDLAQNRMSQLYWLSLRGEGLDDLSRAILCFIWIPENKECTEREGWRPIKDGHCIQQRKLIADQFISATQLQMRVVDETGNREDIEALIGLANITSYHVLGVDGPEFRISITKSGVDADGNPEYVLSNERNDEIRARYRSQKYLDIVRDYQAIIE